MSNLVRVNLDNAKWIDIKRHLSPKGHRKIAMSPTLTTLLAVYIQDWNFTDGTGNGLPINKRSVNALDVKIGDKVAQEIIKNNPAIYGGIR